MKPGFSGQIICVQFIESPGLLRTRALGVNTVGHNVSEDLEMGQAPGFLQLDRAV